MLNLRKLKSAIINVYVAAMLGKREHAETVMKFEAGQLTQNAFLGVVIMSVMSLVVGSVFLYIGIFVNATVRNAIPTSTLTNADNATLLSVSENVNTAFILGGIIMIVIGAAGIISVLLGMVPRGTR